MGAKTRRTNNRKTRTQRRRQAVRRVVYVLNLLLGVATHGCDLVAFGSYWVTPSNLAAYDVRIGREPDNPQTINVTQSHECPVPPPDYLLHPLLGT
jgi:hypothetical protein